MLKRFAQFPMYKLSCIKCTLSSLVTQRENDVQIVEKGAPFQQEENEKSLLEPFSENEDISHISTYLKPTYTVAAYANRSDTIQELVKLGVDIHYIEKKHHEAIPIILRKTFSEIKEYLLFLSSNGVGAEDLSTIITKNPLIIKEKIPDLEVRLNYLKFKRFTPKDIARIILKNPFWLSYSTQVIDSKLGFFQKTFKLSGPEVRTVTVQSPLLITYPEEKVKINIFSLKEEIGFSDEDLKLILLKKPRIFLNSDKRLLKTFNYLHNIMKIPHEFLLECPEILTCREARLKERHQFLQKLNRDQFDRKEPNYVNLLQLASGTDAEFASEVAKSNVEEFNLFLKTL